MEIKHSYNIIKSDNDVSSVHIIPNNVNNSEQYNIEDKHNLINDGNHSLISKTTTNINNNEYLKYMTITKIYIKTSDIIYQIMQIIKYCAIDIFMSNFYLMMPFKLKITPLSLLVAAQIILFIYITLFNLIYLYIYFHYYHVELTKYQFNKILNNKYLIFNKLLIGMLLCIIMSGFPIIYILYPINIKKIYQNNYSIIKINIFIGIIIIILLCVLLILYCQKYINLEHEIIFTINDDILKLVNSNSEQMCSLCLENKYENNKKFIQTTCGHVFHEECMKSYIYCEQQKFIVTKCPTCRKIINPIKLYCDDVV